MADGASSPTAAAEAVAAAARAGEPDRYLAGLLGPPTARAGLLALAAFASEVARVPIATSEPAIGEIRLQWWRDALEPVADNALTGNPIADALRAAIERHALPRALLLEVIEAHSLDLAGEAMADDAALRSYLWKSEGALFALAGRVLACKSGLDVEAAAAACGYAYGLARLLLGLPRALFHGRVPLPQTRLDAAAVTRVQLLAGEGGPNVDRLLADLRAEAHRSVAVGRQHVTNLPRTLRCAFLPLALVQTYLRVLERPGRDLLREPAEITPLRRVVRIAMAHWLGRI